MNDFPTLETDRLFLREIVATDAPDLFAIHSNAEAMRWFGADPLTDIRQAEKLIETFTGWRQMPNPGTRWAIQRKADRQFLGSCGLFKWNRSWQSCILGYELGAFAWGKGFMTEALPAILDWGFENMALNRVEALTHPDNMASIKLIRNLGFTREGYMREAGFWLGQHQDLLLYALLHREHLSRRPSQARCFQ